MTHAKRDMIDALKLELSILRDGGYYPPVHEPHAEPQIFRDSITCLNVGLEVKKEPCDHCFLMRFVPAGQRQESEPCHRIPLNASGETVASLHAAGDRERMEAALISWLQATIMGLEGDLERESRFVAEGLKKTI